MITQKIISYTLLIASMLIIGLALYVSLELKENIGALLLLCIAILFYLLEYMMTKNKEWISIIFP
jgi:hypothetical protein